MQNTATEYAARLVALTDTYQDEKISFLAFNAQNKALWQEIWAADEEMPGLKDAVSAEITRIYDAMMGPPACRRSE